MPRKRKSLKAVPKGEKFVDESLFKGGDETVAFNDDSISEFPVDPVSGNEVPPNVSPENVRDDKTINVSGGEFVFPAYAVNYFGIDKLKNMLVQARKGIEQLEADGLTGKMEEEAPEIEGEITDDMGSFADGGLVGRSQSIIKTYKTKDGRIVFIPMINGQPMSQPPKDAVEIGYNEAISQYINPNKEAEEAVEGTGAGASESAGSKQVQNVLERGGVDAGAPKDTMSFDVSQLSDEELDRAIEDTKAIKDFSRTTPGRLARAAAAATPLGTMVGLGLKAAEITNQTASARRAGYNSFTDQLEALARGISPAYADYKGYPDYSRTLSDMRTGYGTPTELSYKDARVRDLVDENFSYGPDDETAFGPDISDRGLFGSDPDLAGFGASGYADFNDASFDGKGSSAFGGGGSESGGSSSSGGNGSEKDDNDGPGGIGGGPGSER